MSGHFIPRQSFILSILSIAAVLTACRRSPPPKPSPSKRMTETRPRAAVPTLRAALVDAGTIEIDGRLDDPIWRHTGSTGPFVSSPDGRPRPESPVNAEAKVAWNAETLYVAFRVRDRNPVSPFSAADIDPHVWERSSAVELMIQPGDPGNNEHYYEIQVDVAGAIWDTRFDDYNQPITGGPDPKTKRYGHQSWKSNLRKGIVIDERAGNYTVELAIPFASLPSPQATVPPRAGDTWRINLYSFRDGQRETMAWSPILGQGNFHKASRFGRITFAAASAP
jgi:hypothetical protein